jgi:hypothetical protein
MDDYPVKFASCEDVIVHKMRKWLSQFGEIVEHEGIVERFDSLLVSPGI